MTSKLIVNNIEADTGVSTITFGSEISASTFTGNVTGNLTGNVTGNVTSSSTSTFSSGLNVTGGSVGIGTDNPAAKLHLSDTSGALIINRETDSLNQINFRTLNTHRGSIGADSSACFTVYDSASAEKLRITSSGNVAIGHNSPRSKLDVFETVTGNQTAIRIGNTNTPTSANDKRLEFVDGTGTSEGTNKYTYGYIQGYREGGSNSGALIFGTKPDNGSAPSERLRITSSGDVGIGTDNPGTLTWRTGQTLDVFAGSGNATGQLYLGSNRGDGDQSVGSIIFYDNTQTASHQNVAIIEVDKAGSGTNTRGGDILFYNKVDGGTSTPVTFKIRSGGNCEIPDGNLVFASGHGIDFSATSDSSGTATSELFDDYEEGTYTPTITQGFTGITYGTQFGRYTKIGRMVYVQFRITIASGNRTADTNNIRVNLPFTVNADGDNYSTLEGYGTLFTYHKDAYFICFQGESFAALYRRGVNTQATLDGDDFGSTNNFDVIYGGWYYA